MARDITQELAERISKYNLKFEKMMESTTSKNVSLLEKETPISKINKMSDEEFYNLFGDGAKSFPRDKYISSIIVAPFTTNTVEEFYNLRNADLGLTTSLEQIKNLPAGSYLGKSFQELTDSEKQIITQMFDFIKSESEKAKANFLKLHENMEKESEERKENVENEIVKEIDDFALETDKEVEELKDIQMIINEELKAYRSKSRSIDKKIERLRKRIIPDVVKTGDGNSEYPLENETLEPGTILSSGDVNVSREEHEMIAAELRELSEQQKAVKEIVSFYSLAMRLSKTYTRILDEVQTNNKTYYENYDGKAFKKIEDFFGERNVEGMDFNQLDKLKEIVNKDLAEFGKEVSAINDSARTLASKLKDEPKLEKEVSKVETVDMTAELAKQYNITPEELKSVLEGLKKKQEESEISVIEEVVDEHTEEVEETRTEGTSTILDKIEEVAEAAAVTVATGLGMFNNEKVQTHDERGLVDLEDVAPIDTKVDPDLTTIEVKDGEFVRTEHNAEGQVVNEEIVDSANLYKDGEEDVLTLDPIIKNVDTKEFNENDVPAVVFGGEEQAEEKTEDNENVQEKVVEKAANDQEDNNKNKKNKEDEEEEEEYTSSYDESEETVDDDKNVSASSSVEEDTEEEKVDENAEYHRIIAARKSSNLKGGVALGISGTSVLIGATIGLAATAPAWMPLAMLAAASSATFVVGRGVIDKFRRNIKTNKLKRIAKNNGIEIVQNGENLTYMLNGEKLDATSDLGKKVAEEAKEVFKSRKKENLIKNWNPLDNLNLPLAAYGGVKTTDTAFDRLSANILKATQSLNDSLDELDDYSEEEVEEAELYTEEDLNSDKEVTSEEVPTSEETETSSEEVIDSEILIDEEQPAEIDLSSVFEEESTEEKNDYEERIDAIARIEGENKYFDFEVFRDVANKNYLEMSKEELEAAYYYVNLRHNKDRGKHLTPKEFYNMVQASRYYEQNYLNAPKGRSL